MVGVVRALCQAVLLLPAQGTTGKTTARSHTKQQGPDSPTRLHTHTSEAADATTQLDATTSDSGP